MYQPCDVEINRPLPALRYLNHFTANTIMVLDSYDATPDTPDPYDHESVASINYKHDPTSFPRPLPLLGPLFGFTNASNSDVSYSQSYITPKSPYSGLVSLSAKLLASETTTDTSIGCSARARNKASLHLNLPEKGID